MRTTLLLGFTALARFCGGEEAAPPRAAAVAPAPAAARPAHGGVVAVAGDVRAEVVAGAEGRLAVHVGDGRAPVHAVRVAVRDGAAPHPVPVRWDPAERAYVGVAAGVAPGPHPVEVVVQPAADAAPVEVVTAPVTVAAVPAPPARHGGQVALVGDRAVEVVVSRGGDVALFWMDPHGTPMPRAEAAVPSVTVVVDGRPREVPLRAERAYHVGHVDLAPGAAVSVLLPTIEVGGEVYYGLEVERPVLVAEIPGVVVAAPVVVAQAPVVRRAPARTVWVVEEPAHEVVILPGFVGAPGRARGHWRGGDDDDDDRRGRGWGGGRGWGQGRGGGRGHR